MGSFAESNKKQINQKQIGRILMVCTGNTCRSPMAAALARSYLPEAQILSAGVATVDGLPASVGAMEAMAAMGLSLEEHCSKVVSSSLMKEADLILAMTASHKRALLQAYPQAASRVFTLGEFVGSRAEIADPFGLSPKDYWACAQALKELIQKAAAKIKNGAL